MYSDAAAAAFKAWRIADLRLGLIQRVWMDTAIYWFGWGPQLGPLNP